MVARKKQKRNLKFQKLSMAIFVVTFCVYIFGTLCLNSIESAINIEVQRVQYDIEEKEIAIDGLKTARQEKTSFDSILNVAKSSGYELGFATTQIAANN